MRNSFEKDRGDELDR